MYEPIDWWDVFAYWASFIVFSIDDEDGNHNDNQTEDHLKIVKKKMFRTVNAQDNEKIQNVENELRNLLPSPNTHTHTHTQTSLQNLPVGYHSRESWGQTVLHVFNLSTNLFQECRGSRRFLQKRFVKNLPCKLQLMLNL